MRPVLASSSFLAVISALVTAAGCAKPEPVRALASTIDLARATGGAALQGVSARPDGDLDVVVDGRGILTVARDGSVKSTHVPGEHGLWELAYHDVASREDDVFILLSDAEGYLYDARTEQQRVHFCVEPNWDPNEPVIIQKNDAVAAQGNLIVAAPRFYEDDALVESDLRTYRAADGTPIDSVDLMPLGLELQGLTIAGDEILAVQDDALHHFTLDGAHGDVEQLDGVASATGIAVDDDEVFVTDGSAIRVFAR
jgi:hypothetical protein